MINYSRIVGFSLLEVRDQEVCSFHEFAFYVAEEQS